MAKHRRDPREHRPHAPAFETRFLWPRYWPTWLGLALLWVGGLLPRRWWSGLGALVGELYYRLSEKRKRIARINMALCFPALPPSMREARVRAHFRVAMQSLLDMAWLWRASPRQLDARIRFVGLEDYLALHAQGRPLILLTCHTTALEIGGTVISRYFPHISLVKPVRNRLLDWFMTRSRTRFGGRVYARGQSFRPIVRAIKAGAGFYYLPDEDHGRKDSVFAPFFGVPAATLTALGKLARLSDALVVPFFTKRLHDGRYELTFFPPLENFPSNDAITDATAMNAALEKGLREMPEQYFWTYRRFRTRPDNAPSPYAQHSAHA